jgi:hypothetical protein
MGASYTRQSSYTTGDTIQAADTNDEFDQLLAAFNATSGHSHDGTEGEGGPITGLISNTLTFGAGSAGTDITITFDGETNDGILKWMEDEDYFEFPDDILISSNEKLQFRDTAIYINSSTDGQLDIVSDTSVQVVSATFGVDVSGDITLDAGGADVVLKDDGTQYASFTNSSGNLVIKSGSTTAMTFSGANVTFAGTVTIGSAGISEAELEILDGATVTTAELNILDGATVTTTELNIMDGNTSASSTTIVDADRIVLNDDGTMKQVAVTDLTTYITSNITSVGALNSGSITSGFGTIDTGSSTITTTGLITGGSLDIDDVVINGSTIGHTDDTDLITVANGVVTVAGEISVTTLDIGGTNVTATATELNLLDGVSGLVQADFTKLAAVDATATELNIMDGDTSASSITLVDADRVVINDNGTMAQVALSSLATYMEGAIDTGSNITTVGALNAGSITSGFGNIDNGASNITSGGLLKLDVDADADDATGDSATGRLTIGAGEDLNLYHGGTHSYIVNDTGDLVIDTEGDVILDANGADVVLKDNGSQYGALTNSSGNLIIKSGSTTALTFDGANVTIAGDLTVSGDDITMGTNTSGNLLIADGTNFNSVAVSSLSEISTVANDDVFLAVDTSGGGLKKITRSAIVSGLATSAALSNVSEDSTPQLGGDLDVNGNGIVSTSNGNIAITPNGSGVVRLDGNVDIQSGTIDLKNSGSRSKINFYCESGNAHAQALQAAPHSEAASNTLTLPSTGGDVDLVSTASTATLTNKTFGDNVSFGDNNITNVGDIALDSISADGTDINVAVSDNSATALTIKQGSDAYLIIDTADSSESVSIGTGVSGTAITLGHSTSEVTVSDNLTVTGNLTVSGTTTTVDTTNTTIKDNLLELNSGASSNSNDAGIIIQRGSTGNDALIIWDESEDKWALGTTTSSAGDTGNLNMTTGTLVANLEGNVTGTLQTAAQTNITSLGTLTALTVDDVAVDGKVITMTGSSGDTAVFTVGTNGTLSIVTTDAAAAAANIQITADGTAELAGTTVTLDSGGDIELEATDDINIPANVGLTFGNDAEKIEGDGTDLTITGNNINLTASADVVIPANIGITFGSGEKIEGDNTDLTVTSGADINLTATADVNIPANVGITFGDDGEKIEGDGTNLTVASSNNLTLDADGNITIDANGGTITFSDNGSSLGTITSSGYSGNAATATVATTVTITDNESTNEDNAIVFTAGGDVDGGNLGLESDGNLTYNPSTGRLTATQLSGTLQTAAQANITSLGTLTTLTVDDITINGSTISDAGDFTLDVGGDITFDANGADVIFKDDGTQIGRIRNVSSGEFTFQADVSNKRMVFNGNDGGVTVTAFTLDMENAGAATFNSTVTASTGGSAAPSFTFSGDTNTGMFKSANDTIGFTTGGTEQVQIGSFGVATDAITNKTASGDITIDVAGDLIIDVDGAEVKLKDDGTQFGQIYQSSNNFYVQSSVSNKDMRFEVNDAGSITTALSLSGPNAGAATFNDNVTAYSDARLKSDVKTIEGGLEKVSQLRGVTYIRDDNKDGGQRIGVIAQEVEKIIPQVVMTADDEMGTKSVDYGRITAVLIESIKELKAEIDELKEKLNG